MNCDAAQDLLILRLLGELSEADARALDGHLEGCADCRREEVLLQSDFETLGESIPAVPPPADVKRQVLSRIRSDEAESREFTIAFPPVAAQASEPGRTWLLPPSRWVYVAAMLSSVIVGAGAFEAWRAVRRAVAESQVELADQRFEQRIRAARGDREMAEWRFVPFAKPGDDSQKAVLLADPLAREIHLHVAGLGDAEPGLVYGLWLVTKDDHWLRVGDLSGDARGYTLLATMPADWENVVGAAITYDPAGAGPESERGPLVMYSAVHGGDPNP